LAVSSALLVAAAILLRRRKRVRLALVLLLFALLGGWRYQSHPIEPCFTPDDLAFHNGADEEPAWVTVEGIVDDYPDVRDIPILTFIAFYDTLLAQIICTDCNAASGGLP
jgi:hypothetical protein